MLKKIHWNKWGFIPAVILTAVSTILWIIMLQTPRWPLHFNASGHADRYGSPYEFGFLIFIQFVFLIGMGGLDEVLYQSGKRRYNMAGALAAFTNAMVLIPLLLTWRAAQNQPVVLPDLFMLWIFGGGFIAAVIAWLLEQFRHYPEKDNSGTANFIMPDLSQKNWVYWEHINPWWINFLMYACTLMTFGLCIVPAIYRAWPVVIILLACSIFSIIPIGGFYLTVTPEKLSLNLGFLKIPVLKVKIANIASAENHEFNSVTRFGGWGLHYTPWGGWGYVLNNRGVKIKTRKGTRITIGSERPEMLASILQKVQAHDEKNTLE